MFAGPPKTPNVIQVMMQVEQAKTRAKAANKLALETEKEWIMEHVNTQINEIVVMYLSAEKVIRPTVLSDVSV